MELLEVLEVLGSQFESIYIVLDAIDESTPRNDLLRVIRDLATDARFSTIKLLATSREYVDIEQVMSGISAPISMRNPLLDADIKLYLGAKLRSHPKLKRWPVDLQAEVLNVLSEKAEGM